MAASRLAIQYASFVAPRQFFSVAEDVSYLDGSASIALKGIVQRDQNQPRERREDGLYDIFRATLTVLAAFDAIYGCVLLDTSDKIRDFKGRNFSLPVDEGGVAVDGWIVRTITGGQGTWDFGLVREVRTETGKTRRGAQ